MPTGPRCRREVRRFWCERRAGKSPMAIGMKGLVLGQPGMQALHDIRSGPPPIGIAERGHFVQESGEPIAQAALATFNPKEL